MKELIQRTRRNLPTVTAGVALAVAVIGLASTRAASATTSDDMSGRLGCIHSESDLSVAFEQVAECVRPSVVSVQSVRRSAAEQAVMPFHGSPFGFFFGEPGGRAPHPRLPQQEFLQQGLGTGFIISEDGYVITNNHVVENADEVTVTLWDDSSYVASIIGVDPKTDLAVLRIEADGLVPAPLGDNEALRVGSWVAAVGNPFGLSSTMTAGIVSAVGRSRVGLADYEDFIQTDAAINPGNSGGPLVNLAGEVVGINTAIFSRSGGYMGIGFAIPINMAKSIVDSLIENGHVERGFLGVIIQDLDKNLAASFGYEGTDGALVSDVPKDSPAAKAGLEPGDIIVRIGEKHIEDIDMLRLLVAGNAPGTVIPVELVRDGETRVLDVEIGELEPAPVAGRAARTDARSLGMSLQTLTPELAAQLRLGRGQEGVLVTGVEPFGPAARGGLRMNDVILTVDGNAVRSVTEFERELSAADLENGVRLTVQSNSVKRFVMLRAES